MILYDKDATTKQEIKQLILKELEECNFNVGEVVKFKAKDTPEMVITDITFISSNDFITDLTKIAVKIDCEYFSKGRQEFVFKRCAPDVLIKIK